MRRAQPAPDERPLILFCDCGPNGLRVTTCSHTASRNGVSPGMRLAEAEGLCRRAHGGNRPRFVEHKPVDDRAGLLELAAWCQEFSPLVGVEGTDSLMLDVTGCAHLFGGESGLTQRVQRGVTLRGLRAVLSIAGTIGAAWAVAHYTSGPECRIVPPDQQTQCLGSLPVAALRLPEPVLETLRTLGLNRIEQLLALPRSSLPSRVGPEVLQRLDQALGDAPELIVPIRPAAPVTVAITLPTPTADRAALEFVLRDAVDQIVRRLAERCEGVQQLEVCLDCGASDVTFLAGTMQPTACTNHLSELILTHLERTVLPGEVQALRLTVRQSGLLDVRQRQLFEQDDRETQRRELARLVDRLSNRLGKQRVVRPGIQPEILPELALRWQPLLDGPPPASRSLPTCGIVAARPLRLWPQPQAIAVVSVVPDGPPLCFDRAGRTQVIAHCWGPERLAAGWWRGGHVQRDYYRVETERGQRFWLFRRIREGDWYLHGEFA